MVRVTINVSDQLKGSLDKAVENERISMSRFISRILEDFLLEESDDAILERVNQVENKLDQYVDKLTLIDSRLNGLSLQLEKLKIPT